MLRRRNAIILGAIAVIVVGFALVKVPTPPIAIAAESIIDLGGYTVTNTILTAWVILVLMTVMTLILYRRLRNIESAIVPTGFQNLVEAFLEAFYDVVKLVAGERGARRFFPVVATIFVFLLLANWFGLLPFNNAIGKTVDVRAHYLEELEHDAEKVLAHLDDGVLGADMINDTYGTFYMDPIPVAVESQSDADIQISEIRSGVVSRRAAAVRKAFRDEPISASIDKRLISVAIEERLENVLKEYPFTEEELHGLHAHDSVEGLEKAIIFNLPLLRNEITETELHGAVLNAGAANIIPIKADDFSYDPFIEPLFVTLNADGGFSDLRNSDLGGSESNGVPDRMQSEFQAPVTVNTAHLGIIVEQEKEGVDAGQGIGEIFPFFRSIATDINLPLALALWSFIFVQFWGIQSLGVRSNFGRFIGVGKAAVVKGPVGVLVGFLEIISEVSRIVSFTFRLFGNIFAGEILLFMTAFIVPFLAATVFYGLEVFVGFIQAFVFAMLTLVFAVTAVSHGEHSEDDQEEVGGHEA